MHKKESTMQKRTVLFVAVLAISTMSLCAYAIADHHSDHKENRWKSEEHHRDKDTQAGTFISNKLYESTCGSCHWAYIPQLLPSSSWSIILSSLNNHFGSEVSATDQDIDQIKQYVMANAADKTDMKIGRKIVRHLTGKPPLRITDIPYIRHKHNDIPQNVFARKGVQSFANCNACHPSAASGHFDDDSVRIPAE